MESISSSVNVWRNIFHLPGPNTKTGPGASGAHQAQATYTQTTRTQEAATYAQFVLGMPSTERGTPKLGSLALLGIRWVPLLREK